jgi:hypothetical protein
MTIMEKDGFKFDLTTQRFLINRWETDEGEKVRQKIVEGLKASSEIRGILDSYVLEHENNSDPYAHPIYPLSEMTEGAFWVLTHDDLRGIQLYDEDFKGSKSFAKKALSYARFHDCNLKEANLERSELSYATFHKCNLADAIFAMSGGFNANFLECDMGRACFFDVFLHNCDLSGSNLEDVYFERATLKNISVNHKTRFSHQVRSKWSGRTLPEDQIPDILRSIRIAYENAEIWDSMDTFLVAEQRAKRKALLWHELLQAKSFKNFSSWFGSLARDYYCVYSTSPVRVVFVSFLIPLIFALLYWGVGVPTGPDTVTQAFGEALYYSFTTFTTLGFGDVVYEENRPFLRVLSTLEAFAGTVSLSLLVVIFARKIIR